MRKHFTNLVWLWDYPFSLLVSSPVGSNKAGGAWIKLWPQINEQFWFYFGHKLIAMFAYILQSSQRKLKQERGGTHVVVFCFSSTRNFLRRGCLNCLSKVFGKCFLGFPSCRCRRSCQRPRGATISIIKIFKRERVRYTYIRMYVTFFGFRPYFKVENV